MKKILLIVLIALCFSQVNAQNIVKYDFKSKDPPSVPTAILGQNSIYKIININKFIYEISIETSQSEFNSEPPAVFLSIFKIEETEVEASVQDSPLSLGFTKSSLDWKKYKLESYNKDLLEFQSIPKVQQDVDKINELNNKIKTLSKEIETQKNLIPQLDYIIDEEYLKKTTELYTNAKTVYESFEKLEETKTIKNKLVRLALTDGLNYEEAIVTINTIQEEYPFILKPESLLASFNSQYRYFKIALQLHSLDPVVLRNFDYNQEEIMESTINLVTEIDNIKKIVDDFNYNELFQNIATLYSELQNENNFFIASDPVQAKKDIINYLVSIKPRKGIESFTTRDTRKFTTEVPIEGGVKIDFSTGIFVVGGLHNKSYSTALSIEDSTKSVITENTNNDIGNLSLGALMHVSKRTTSNFKIGFTFGLGVNSTELNNATIFVGASAIFGRQEHFIISLGASMSKIDYLKPEYSTDTYILTSKISDELTEKTSRVGWFVSFTYKLSNKKKE